MNKRIPPHTMGSDTHLSQSDFQRLAQLVRREAGLDLPEMKEVLVYSRLVARVRELGFADFGQYADLLAKPGAERERQRLINALTTNTTQFFREKHHFTYLADSALPSLVAQARKGARLRLWSAGCSSGEEAYSLAFTLLAFCPDAAQLDIKILATDIDADVLAQAIQGKYPTTALQKLPETLIARHFTKTAADFWEVNEEARSLIRFRPLNLIKPFPMRGPFDIIFCRNVAIYFDAATQDLLWQQLNAVTASGGYLFLGHSERLSSPTKDDFGLQGVTIYRKRQGHPSGAAAPSDQRQSPEGGLPCP